MKPFELVQATSAEEAVKATTEVRDAKLKAAGVDLLDEMKAFVTSPGRVVNLLKIKEMRGIVASKAGTEIGALTTLAEVASHADIAGGYAALAEAAREVATPEVRNMATVGGNLCQRPRCWYYRLPVYTCLKKGGNTCYAIEGDNKYHAVFETGKCPIAHPSNLAPALMVFDARLHIAGSAEEIAVADFFSMKDIKRENVLAHGDVIKKVVLPVTKMTSAYRETREKQSFDWALTSAAVGLELDGKTCKKARVVLGAVAPVPLRRPEVEKLLEGKEVTAALAEEAGAKAAEGATPLSMNKYKVKLIKAVVRRAIVAAAGLKGD